MTASVLPLADLAWLLPEIVLTIGALVMLVANVLVPRWSRWLTSLALACLGATLAAVFVHGAGPRELAGGLLVVDAFAVFVKVTFIGVAMLTVLMSDRYLAIEGVSPGEYHFLVLCATLGMLVMAGAVDLVTAFIGLETMAVSFYILSGYLKPNPRSNEAAVKYFLLGAFSLAILLYGLSLLYAVSGTTRLSDLAMAAGHGTRDPRLLLAIVLVTAGFGFKIAAVPFHMWAPDVYEGAPTPVTAFLSVGSKAASFALLMRVLVVGLPGASADWSWLLGVMAVVTMTVGNLAALTQSNIKRMLAYSSVAHAGYMLIGLVAGTERGLAAVLFYLPAYALMQVGAFAVVVLMRQPDAVGDELKDLAGLHQRQPLAAFAMLLFLLALGGTPPTVGFMGKFRLFAAAVESGHVWLAVVGVLNSVVSLYYYLRLVMFMYQRAESPAPAPVFPRLLAVTIGMAAVGTVVAGIYPGWLIDAADVSARALGAVGTVAGLR